MVDRGVGTLSQQPSFQLMKHPLKLRCCIVDLHPRLDRGAGERGVWWTPSWSRRLQGNQVGDGETFHHLPPTICQKNHMKSQEWHPQQSVLSLFGSPSPLAV